MSTDPTFLVANDPSEPLHSRHRKRLRLTRPEPAEAQVLRSVLRALSLHPKVAWAQRMNTGLFRPERKDGSRGYVRAGFIGCSDVIGMMKDGRFLAVEVKRPSGKLTQAQEAFLEAVRCANGVGLVARGVDDVFNALAGL